MKEEGKRLGTKNTSKETSHPSHRHRITPSKHFQFFFFLLFAGESEAALNLAPHGGLRAAAASPPAAEAAKPTTAAAAATVSGGSTQDRVQRPLLPQDLQLRLHEEEEQEGGGAAAGAAAEAQPAATAAAATTTAALQLRQQRHLRMNESRTDSAERRQCEQVLLETDTQKFLSPMDGIFSSNCTFVTNTDEAVVSHWYSYLLFL